MPEVRIGLVPDVGGTTRLTRTVGYARSKELIMTARMIEAADAEKIGLVNRVVAEGTHLAAAEELAREMTRNAPLAVGLAKRIIDKGHGLDKMTFQELEVLAQSSLLLTEDFREGASALAQRRDPKLQGTLRRISKPASKVSPGASSRIPAATPRAARLKASGAQVYGSIATTALSGGA